MAGPLLAVDDLSVAFDGAGGPVAVVRGLSFQIGPGEFLGLVGESGCGKSITALALLRLVPEPGRITGGRILLDGQNLLERNEAQMRRVRGGRIGMIFQEPMSALNPVLSVGFQIAEAVRVHHPVTRHEAREEAVRLLELVAIPAPRQRLKDYPHQLSGGQRQRVMIAIALAAKPDLVIADEPTTALDVTVQAQILELLESLRQKLGLAVLLITHDLAVVAETCDRVVVMYAGQAVEQAPVGQLFAAPAHPYTRGLLAAVPRLGGGVRGGELPAIPGQVPEPARLPGGCAFHPRCGEVMDDCRERQPEIFAVAERQTARCFLHRPPTVETHPS
jgi:oligopeptide/dipeptide ABC transporter ATP-binding protein